MNFDLDIKEAVAKLIKLAEERFPNRSWKLEVTFWQDSDYQIILASFCGGKQDEFEYTKSTGEVIYAQRIYEAQKRFTHKQEEILHG